MFTDEAISKQPVLKLARIKVRVNQGSLPENPNFGEAPC
jgi:hypothetical protein